VVKIFFALGSRASATDLVRVVWCRYRGELPRVVAFAENPSRGPQIDVVHPAFQSKRCVQNMICLLVPIGCGGLRFVKAHLENTLKLVASKHLYDLIPAVSGHPFHGRVDLFPEIKRLGQHTAVIRETEPERKLYLEVILPDHIVAPGRFRERSVALIQLSFFSHRERLPHLSEFLGVQFVPSVLQVFQVVQVKSVKHVVKGSLHLSFVTLTVRALRVGTNEKPQ